MSSTGLNIGLNALLTSQAALDTVGHNIANANTPGYSRQTLELQPARTNQMRGLQIGGGVDAKTVRRTVDDLINQRLFSQVSVTKQLEARLEALSDTEALLGEPSGVGISDMLGEMYSKLAELSATPTDAVVRTGAVQAIDTLASQIQGVASQLDVISRDVVGRVHTSVEQVNRITEGIATLNRQIIGVETSGGQANDLRDQRELFIRQLSELASVTVTESRNGASRVFLEGQMIVGEASAIRLEVDESGDGSVQLLLEGGVQPVQVSSGTLGGLTAFMESSLPGIRGEFDRLAQNLILEVNRRHSQGTPPEGGFRRLTSDMAVVDSNANGSWLDERLGDLDGPFDVQDGSLFVQVTEQGTGTVTSHRIDIDAQRTTVGSFLDDLSDAAHLSASLDSAGQIQIQAASGYTFDFSRRVDPNGNSQGTLGGGAASLGSATGEPFSLTPGSVLTLDSGSGSFDIEFNPGDFANMGFASAHEVADVINTDADSAVNGVRAVVAGGQVVLQSLAEGASASFTVVGGGVATALGWSPATTVTGQDRAVDVQLSGRYSGDANKQLIFRPNMDGEIGGTAGLVIDVVDGNGTTVASLDVGPDYLPGTELSLPEGLSVSFSSGQVSATDGDVLARDLIADSDTADVLVALGLNGLLTGTDAASISVSQRILDDPGLLASSVDGTSGDNGVLIELLDLQDVPVEGLAATIGEFYTGLVGDLGQEVQSADRALEIEGQLMESLETRRDQVSGVSLDEELVNLIQFEQAFGAAARFIQTVGTLQDEVLNLL